MYQAASFGVVADGAQRTLPIDIRQRDEQIVAPLKVAYIISLLAVGAARAVTWGLSRSTGHRADPPSLTEIIGGGAGFFGVVQLALHWESGVGNTPFNYRLEADLRGVLVADDLTVCIANDAGVAILARAEFYYDIQPISRVDKAAAIWRRETREQPN